MGKNFFGLTEAKKYFGITLTEKQVTALEKVPWSKDILKACKDTHILVLVFPVSILNLRHMVDYDFFAKHNDAKYNKKKFAKHDGEAGWYLVLKTAVSDSFEKKLDVQQKLLSDNDEVCSAQVMVYITVACRLANGEVLFPNIYVRTSDIDGSGHCVAIGHDKKERLCIDLNWRPNHKLSYTGLSCGKKRRMK